MTKYLSAKRSIEEIITGDSQGADALAKKFGEENNIPVRVYPKDKKAIVENCDAIIAFWDGKSTNTQDVLKLAKQLKKPLEVIFLEKKEHDIPFGYITLNNEH